MDAKKIFQILSKLFIIDDFKPKEELKIVGENEDFEPLQGAILRKGVN